MEQQLERGELDRLQTINATLLAALQEIASHDQDEYVALAEFARAAIEHAHFTADVRDANARLIAAAPDLLACCIRAVNESARVHPDFLEQLRAAIAKATQ